MSHEPKPLNVNGGATAHDEATFAGDNHYNNNANAGYQGSGGSIARFITPGGNPIDTSQPAFPVFHRK
jgi:hypothetical protein